MIDDSEPIYGAYSSTKPLDAAEIVEDAEARAAIYERFDRRVDIVMTLVDRGLRARGSRGIDNDPDKRLARIVATVALHLAEELDS